MTDLHSDSYSESYSNLILSAIERSKRFGMTDLTYTRMKSIFHHDQLIKMTDEWYLEREREFETTSRIFLRSAFDDYERANLCAAVHSYIALGWYMGVVAAGQSQGLHPTLTIGTIEWGDDLYFDCNDEVLNNFFKSHDIFTEFPAHVWLTLNDANQSIIDFTLPMWQCKQNREPFNFHESGALKIFAPSRYLRDPSRLNYTPYLVGPEFLYNTESFPEDFKTEFHDLYLKWGRDL